MASTYSPVKCPQCGCTAIEDYYYKIDEVYICCYRCGYSYVKGTVATSNEKGELDFEYKEEHQDGQGVLRLFNKDGNRDSLYLRGALTEEKIEEYKQLYDRKDIDQEKSYLVTFQNGVFTTLFGALPEEYYLPFEEYQELMKKRHGTSDWVEVIFSM